MGVPELPLTGNRFGTIQGLFLDSEPPLLLLEISLISEQWAVPFDQVIFTPLLEQGCA